MGWGMGLWGLEGGVQGMGLGMFRVWGVWGLEYGVQGMGSMSLIQGLGYGVLLFRSFLVDVAFITSEMLNIVRDDIVRDDIVRDDRVTRGMGLCCFVLSWLMLLLSLLKC